MSEPLIRRTDRAVLAALTAIALVGFAIWWVRAGGLHGELVDIDLAPGLEYQFLVDINRAEWPELAQIPGMGPILAQRIVESRTNDGDFRSVEDLRRIQGIGARTLDRMRPYVAPMPGDHEMAVEGSSEQPKS